MNRAFLLRRVLPAAGLALILAAAGAGIAVGQGAVTPLARDCSDSALDAHTGFQDAPRCVSTAFGEVAAAATNPSLLISKAPEEVRSGKDFKLKISSDNLVRDRFLAAAQGGYYLESALLNDDGLTRGHLHVACRTLASSRTAPAPELVPGFFKAIEDGGGGAEPDTVTVTVPGKAANGNAVFRKGSTVQCAVWAGDGSHRTPMMQRANQTPAFDTVRIRIR